MSVAPGDDTDLGHAPELALLAVTLAAVVGVGRLFTDGSFLAPLLLAAVGGHALAWATRRAGFRVGSAAVVSAVGLLICVAWVLEPSSTAYGLPLGRTWHALATDLTDAWDRFGRVIAPAKPERGFVLAAAVAVWSGGFVADWAAFRVNAAFEATVPAFTLFVFTATLGTSRGRLPATALFLAAVLAFLLIHAAARRAEATAWFASRVHGGPRAIVQAGAGMAVATVLAALVAGPLLPGARSPALLDWRNRERGAGSRVTVSPLVDIRSRLVNQTDTEVFTVRSPVRAYWRLTSLDAFDGQVWGSKGSYRNATGTLRLDVPSRADVQAGVQEFSIEALDTPWLPAAYRPDRYDGPAGVSFDPDSASLLTDATSGTGTVYRVRSRLPALDAAALAAVPAAVPADIARRYLELPVDFPRNVVRLAGTVTAGRTTPYAKALALQNWFRDNFTYSLDVPAGHGDTAIERFLAGRVGYCEQFAGTYAAMARAIGLPARVAVGFTPGELRADGLYHVTGRQAHAWPEVYLAGFGWVAFEPTPGRGVPGAQAYTGVPDQQDTSRGQETATPTTAATGTTLPGTAGSAPSRLPNEDLRTGTTGTVSHRRSPWPGRLRAFGIVAAVVVLLWLAGVPLAYRLRRRRRHAGATTATDRTLVAWAEVQEALALAGTPRRPSETDAEYARRASGATGLDGQLTDLAGDATAAAFGPRGVSDDVAVRSEGTAVAVVGALHGSASRVTRLRWSLDPRPLLAGRAPRPPR